MRMILLIEVLLKYINFFVTEKFLLGLRTQPFWRGGRGNGGGGNGGVGGGSAQAVG